MMQEQCTTNNRESTLNEDDWDSVLIETFQDYEEGPFTEGYNAIAEVHYPEKQVYQGPWEEIASYHTFPKHHVSWVIKKNQNSNVLRQTGLNSHNLRNWKYPIKKYLLRRRMVPNLFFPALATGDKHWTDYRLRTRLSIDSKEEIAGLLFRMLDSRHHYIFCLKKDQALLLRREHNNLHRLAKQRYKYTCHSSYTLEVSVEGCRILCFINDDRIFDLEDPCYQRGKAGLITNVPAEYSRVEIFMKRHSKKESEQERDKHLKMKKARLHSYPSMKLWKKIPLKNTCSGRSIRFGDLTGNGQTDMILAQAVPLLDGNNYNMINCLTAMDLDGHVLWQNGRTHEEKNCLCSDLALQIYDIDNDGNNEVICAKDYYLQILNGRTGEVKAIVPTPPSVPPYNKVPQVIGDAISICNLSGGPSPREILLKDRYSKIWAYDHNLKHLWEYHYKKGEMGHFPFAMDIDGDGRDEILVGYALLSPDGKKLWDLELADHADAVAMVRLSNTNQWVVAMAASDEGFILADIKGNIKKHLRLGHMQTVTFAKLRPDVPGYQFATNTYWGNPGIIYILDESGNVLTSFQPSTYGSPICPVHWIGDGQEFLLLSATPDEKGGLYDGYGRQTVAFPKDGHPTLCYDAFDINGDGIEELFCWDHDRLWIYIREETPSAGVFPAPQRYPTRYNASNYRSNVSVRKSQ